MFPQVRQVGAIYQIPPAIDSLQWCKVPPDGENATSQAASPDDIDFDRLVPTLFECFAVVFCGFLAGRCNLISRGDIKGLNDFTTYFTLPPLIFLNLASIDLRGVEWRFVAGVLLAKAAVFLLVALVTASVRAASPRRLAYAGLYGIFCTQGNDFGLAYPIIASLYGSKRPLYPGYMYLIAPTSLLFLNPLGFVLMEAQRNRGDPDGAPGKTAPGHCLRSAGGVAWSIVRNPVVFVTLLGVCGNFVFRAGLPNILFGILQILSSAFSASVLFLLGFSVAGTGESKYSKKEGLLIPSVLLITKMLVSPLITRSCVSMLCSTAADVEDLADYGFLYGMVPTGPIVMLFAAEYGLRTEMLASTMVLCTGLFGPVVFILARMLSLKVRGIQEFADELQMTMLVLSIMSILSCLWIGFCFLVGRKTKRHIYRVTGCLMISQVVLALGICTWSLCGGAGEWMTYVQVTLISGGQIMSRTWTAILAVTMVFLRKDPSSPFARSLFWPCSLGFGFPLLVVIMILIVTGIGQCEPDLDNELPLFIYGTTEALGSIVVLLICLAATSICLVLYYRAPTHRLLRENETSSVDKSVGKLCDDVRLAIDYPSDAKVDKALADSANIAIFKLTKSDSESVIPQPVSFPHLHPSSKTDDTAEKVLKKVCDSLNRSETSFSEKHLLSSSNESSVQSSPTHSSSASTRSAEVKDDSTSAHLRHVILLILCCISMAVGLTISTWKLSSKQPNGLFVAMEFLDAVLNVGQGVFVFLVFFKDGKYILTPLSKCLRTVRHGFYSISDPQDCIDAEDRQLCHQFHSYHLANCMRDLPRPITKNHCSYSDCFTGTEFVDWLIKVGLASHRTSAENYGQRLFRAAALVSADGAVQFHDNGAYLYKLTEVDYGKLQ